MRRKDKRDAIVTLELKGTDIETDFLEGSTSVIFENEGRRRTVKLAQNPQVNIVGRKPKAARRC